MEAEQLKIICLKNVDELATILQEGKGPKEELDLTSHIFYFTSAG